MWNWGCILEYFRPLIPLMLSVVLGVVLTRLKFYVSRLIRLIKRRILSLVMECTYVVSNCLDSNHTHSTNGLRSSLTPFLTPDGLKLTLAPFWIILAFLTILVRTRNTRISTKMLIWHACGLISISTFWRVFDLYKLKQNVNTSTPPKTRLKWSMFKRVETVCVCLCVYLSLIWVCMCLYSFSVTPVTSWSLDTIKVSLV